MSEVSSQIDYAEVLSQGVVDELNYYPIKSGAGIPVSEIDVVDRGFKHDRELMVVAAEPVKRKNPGEFLTQREFPSLAVVEAEIDEDTVTVETPNMPLLTVPLIKVGDIEQNKIWRDRVEVIDQGDDIAEWFSRHLGALVRVVRMPDSYVRQVDQQFASRETDQVGLADGYSALLTSLPSLRDLNSRLARPIGMDRFRPNIVVDGLEIAYGEDRIRKMSIGDVVFEGVKPCARCVTTTVDQETGEKELKGQMTGEPLRTLATYRTALIGGEKGVIFGMNLTHENNGSLKIGDSITVFETQEPPEFLTR